jgi:hypothetical protein
VYENDFSNPLTTYNNLNNNIFVEDYEEPFNTTEFDLFGMVDSVYANIEDENN